MQWEREKIQVGLGTRSSQRTLQMKHLSQKKKNRSNKLSIYESMYYCIFRFVNFFFNEGLSDTSYNVASFILGFVVSAFMVFIYKITCTLSIYEYNNQYASAIWLLFSIFFIVLNYFRFVYNDKYVRIFRIGKKSYNSIFCFFFYPLIFGVFYFVFKD